MKNRLRWVIRVCLFSLLFALSVGLGAILIAYSSAGLIYDYRDTASQGRLPETDVIVCLAGAKGRITAATDLWVGYTHNESREPPVLYLSGVGHQATWAAMSNQFSTLAQGRLREDAVVLERQSANTEENAIWFAQMAKREGWKRMVLVTSGYHMRRALWIFRRVLGKDFRIDTYSVQQQPYTSEHWTTESASVRVTLIEFLKWSYLRLTEQPQKVE